MRLCWRSCGQVCGQKGPKQTSVMFFLLLFFLDLLQTLAVKEALGLVALSLTTGFLLWPGFQTLDFTNIHIAAKGILPKPLYTHAQTQTLQLHLLKQATKLWARAPWGAVRHRTQQNSWHSQHVRSMYCQLWEACISGTLSSVSTMEWQFVEVTGLQDKYWMCNFSVSLFILEYSVSQCYAHSFHYMHF